MTALLLWLVLAHPATCTVTGLNPVRLVCRTESQHVELLLEDSQWPASWGSGPHLTGVYKAELAGESIVPLTTLTDLGRNEAIRAATLREQQRWRIPPAQVSGR